MMNQTGQEETSNHHLILVNKLPPGPGPPPTPPPTKCVNAVALSERRDRKNLQSKCQSAARKAYAKEISLKPKDQRTHEETIMVDLIEKRRLRKNQRAQQRMQEEQTKVDRIFEKHEQDRTVEESNFMDTIRRRTTRKNEGDRLRRLRQRLGDRDDLKLEPILLTKKRGPTGYASGIKRRRCSDCHLNDGDVTMEQERRRREVIATQLYQQSPTSWPTVQEDFELPPFDLLQVLWRTEACDVVVPSFAPLVPHEENHFQPSIDESSTNKSACSEKLILDNRRTTHPPHPLLMMQPALAPVQIHGEQCTYSNSNSMLFTSVNDLSSNGVSSSSGAAPASLVFQSLPWYSQGQQVQCQNNNEIYGQHQAAATPRPEHFNSSAPWEIPRYAAFQQEMNNCIMQSLPTQICNPVLCPPSIRCFAQDTKSRATSEAYSWSDGHIAAPTLWDTNRYEQHHSFP
jgi:hypothetical protein